jgi:hypothetical protein
LFFFEIIIFAVHVFDVGMLIYYHYNFIIIIIIIYFIVILLLAFRCDLRIASNNKLLTMNLLARPGPSPNLSEATRVTPLPIIIIIIFILIIDFVAAFRLKAAAAP